MPVKYVFVTGGVVSGLGKGITAASLGRLLKARGYKVTMQKFDPYINMDPGTMNPIQHGEVFVTDDGTETDLDLGHYERFYRRKSGQELKRNHREKHRAWPAGIMRHGGKIQPRHAGNRTEIIRPARLGLDTLHVAPFLHIPAHRRIKHRKIRRIFTPNIRKRVIIRMKNRVGRMADLVIAQRAVPICHAQLLLAVDRAHNGIQHRRIKPQAVCACHATQRCHIQPGRHRVIGADALGIVFQNAARAASAPSRLVQTASKAAPSLFPPGIQQIRTHIARIKARIYLVFSLTKKMHLRNCCSASLILIFNKNKIKSRSER